MRLVMFGQQQTPAPLPIFWPAFTLIPTRLGSRRVAVPSISMKITIRVCLGKCWPYNSALFKRGSTGGSLTFDHAVAIPARQLRTAHVSDKSSTMLGLNLIADLYGNSGQSEAVWPPLSALVHAAKA